MEASVGQRVACGEIVRAVEHDVETSDKHPSVLGVEPLSNWLDRDMRIDAGDRGLSAVGLRPPDIVRCVDHLSMQIGERDGIVIDDPERPDSGPGQILQRWRAKSARANHKGARGFELVLAGSAQPMQNDLTRVAFNLFAREAHGCV
jgi:hypothetical protein